MQQIYIPKILQNAAFMQMFFLLFYFFSSVSQAVTLGQSTIQDSHWQFRSLTYEQHNNFALVEGDIILSKMANLGKKDAAFRLKLGGAHWEKGVVPYEVSDSLPLISKIAIYQAIEHWQKYTFVQFIELTNKNHHSYKDYITFLPSSGTTCASYVGKQGGQQEIILSTRCRTMSVVHEIGHALGLWHEQSRADRDNYIQIIWENIEESHRFNFNQHINDSVDFGEYDYQSIMHYNAYAFSKNGEKTLVPLIEGTEIGQRNKLSEKDIAAVNAMYPKTT